MPNPEQSERYNNARDLVFSPREALAIELKQWFDPASEEGKARIVRTLFSLRNHDGGWLLIGFRDDTLDPTSEGMPGDVKTSFHPDEMQSLVSKFASEIFAIETLFIERSGRFHPAILVPRGIQTPVACKRELKSLNGALLLRTNDIFVRTLETNGTVSSARLPWRDLPTLVGTCFQNRESSMVPLLTKVLGGLDKVTRRSLLDAFKDDDDDPSKERGKPVNPGTPPINPSELVASPLDQNRFLDSAQELLALGSDRFRDVQSEAERIAPEIGTFEIALVIGGEVPPQNTGLSFLSRIFNANPNLTGWPVWLDSRSFHDETERPYPHAGKWEAYVMAAPGEDLFPAGHVDFMILDPAAKFYLLRGLQDDLAAPERVTPGAYLDPFLMICRIAEAIVVSQSFAKAMGYQANKSELFFCFRWRKLKNRRIRAWATPLISTGPSSPSRDDAVQTSATVRIEADAKGIAAATHEALAPLFHCFGGFEVNEEVIRHWVEKLLSRTL